MCRPPGSRAIDPVSFLAQWRRPHFRMYYRQRVKLISSMVTFQYLSLVLYLRQISTLESHHSMFIHSSVETWFHSTFWLSSSVQRCKSSRLDWWRYQCINNWVCKIISAAERVLKLFQDYFSDIEHVGKYSWTAISLWNNFSQVSTDWNETICDFTCNQSIMQLIQLTVDCCSC